MGKGKGSINRYLQETILKLGSCSYTGELYYTKHPHTHIDPHLHSTNYSAVPTIHLQKLDSLRLISYTSFQQYGIRESEAN